MDWRPPAELLRVERDAIPAVRTAFEDALAELTPQLLRLHREATIPEPWMGDRTSESIHIDYQQRVIEAGDGPLAAMRAYEIELTRILDSLRAMEDNYLRTDGDIAGGMGQSA